MPPKFVRNQVSPEPSGKAIIIERDTILAQITGLPEGSLVEVSVNASLQKLSGPGGFGVEIWDGDENLNFFSYEIEIPPGDSSRSCKVVSRNGSVAVKFKATGAVLLEHTIVDFLNFGVDWN